MLLQRHPLINIVFHKIGNRRLLRHRNLTQPTTTTTTTTQPTRTTTTTTPTTQLRKMASSAPSKSVVAISQMQSTNDKEKNLRQVKDLVRSAKTHDATFLFLPECCDFIGEDRVQTLQLSEPLNGYTMQQYQELAKEFQIWLSLGGVHETILDAGGNNTNKIFNAHVLINHFGEIVSVYRKLHLFDVETPEFRFKESEIVEPGPKLVSPVETPIGRLGLQICYDVRFAEPSLLLRKLGAQIIAYPSAFAYSTGKDHWEVLMRARAIENQCYVLAPAQIGYHNKKRRSYGHAMAIDPWGKVIANCGGEEKLAIATAEIDLTMLEGIYKNMPCFQHRRQDLYSLTAFDLATDKAVKNQRFACNTIDKTTIFYETEHCFAFTNLRCVVEGHVLVSTKRVVSRLSGLSCAEMTDLFSTVCLIQRMLEAFYNTTSATVTVQDGTDAGQTVPHVHFHIMPRRPGDFGHNDQIYVKLEDRCVEKPDRNMGERVSEAQKYRDFMTYQK